MLQRGMANNWTVFLKLIFRADPNKTRIEHTSLKISLCSVQDVMNHLLRLAALTALLDQCSIFNAPGPMELYSFCSVSYMKW